VVRDVAASGTTIVYTTHYLEEAEILCDRIGIMDHGKILAEGSLDELKRRSGTRELVTVRGSFEESSVHEAFGNRPDVQIVSAEHGKTVLAVEGNGTAALHLVQRILDGALPTEGVEITPPSLNRLFLDLTGREIRD
jgi:ABC-2 type transport system ATP-binding protein